MGELANYITAYYYIVPAARAKIAKALVNTYNMSEKDAAKLLGVTQAAVSKYVSEKYSAKIKEIEAKIDQAIVDNYVSKVIAGSEEQVGRCICSICQSIHRFDCMIKSEDIGE